ncbi:hypothetical protein V6N13_018011 [Hibiscus sabdariffa]|uniref:Cation/H+ exchanger domain-containing protein n=1 Tax=Hibiscus sabdariffa TaxID=183260 RepID=A0ABR2CH04_9ROSI
MDASLTFKSGKKAVYIGFLTVLVPLLACLITNKVFHPEDYFFNTNKFFLAVSYAGTSFPVIHNLLSELKILNSELGRLGLSAALVVVVFVLRPGIKWMVKHISETSQKKDICFYLVILAFMLSPPITKQFHLHAKFGPFILGLVVPDGPPLGSALVEKLDPIISGFFLPIFATTCGIRVDPSSFKKISTFLINQSIGAVVTVVVKFGVSLALAMFCKMPMRDSLALAFVMISKGIVEIGYYSSMSDSMVISKPHYAFLIYMSTLIAIIVPILVKWLYDPSRKYLCFQKRTIMNFKPNQELRVLGCVHVPGNVNSIINLLNVCCLTRESSLALDVLHLVKLSGRATPLFIAHEKQELMTSDDSYSENVVIAFKQFERHNAEVVSLNVFTAVSPPNLMYEDICNLAIEHSTCFILLPFHRRWYIDGSIESEDQTIRSLNCNILETAPCSVGILVEGRCKVSFSTFRDPPSSQSYSSYNIAVIFMGGKDDREALALAKRISQDESVSLTVIHLKAKNSIGTILAESDRALDDEMLSGIKGSMRYLEEQISDGPETSNFLRSIVEDYQLFIVGRRYKCEDPQTSGLELWCEFEEIDDRSLWIFSDGSRLKRIVGAQIAAAWGSLEALGENANQALGCEKVSLLISTSQQEKIEELLEVVVGSEVFVVRVYEVRFLRIVTGKQGFQSQDKMVKEPVADVEESSSDSSETGDRWKKTVGQIGSPCGEDESFNDAFMGNYSQGINLHRGWEENRLLGEAELLGCSPDGDVNLVSPRADIVDSPKFASNNLGYTKWADIVSIGPGDPSQPALPLNPDQNVFLSDLGGVSACSSSLPSWAETIDKLNSIEAESHDRLNIPSANEEEQSENSDCSLPCSTNEARMLFCFFVAGSKGVVDLKQVPYRSWRGDGAFMLHGYIKTSLCFPDLHEHFDSNHCANTCEMALRSVEEVFMLSEEDHHELQAKPGAAGARLRART